MKNLEQDDFEFHTKNVDLSKQNSKQSKQKNEPNYTYNSAPKFSRKNVAYPKNFKERVNQNRGSSGNIKKAKSNSKEHNERLEEPSYLLPPEYRQQNETWNCGISEQKLYEQELQKYNEIKKGYNGKRPAFENCKWEMIININQKHDMKDVKNVAEHVANKFNFHNTRIAIHRDEGRFIDLDNPDEKTNTLIIKGDKKNCYKQGDKFYWDKELNKEIKNVGVAYNYHAHLNFLTIKDARQNMRREHIKREHLSELQTELAQMLDMPRGEILKESEKSSEKKHKGGREYAKDQHEQQEYLLSLKEQKEITEFERKASFGKGYTPEYFRELKRLATKEPKSKDELEKEIKELKIKHDKFYSSKEYAKALENKIIELNDDKNELLNIIKQTNDNFAELVEQTKKELGERLEKTRLENYLMKEVVKDDFIVKSRINDRFKNYDIAPIENAYDIAKRERSEFKENFSYKQYTAQSKSNDENMDIEQKRRQMQLDEIAKIKPSQTSDQIRQEKERDR